MAAAVTQPFANALEQEQRDGPHGITPNERHQPVTYATARRNAGRAAIAATATGLLMLTSPSIAQAQAPDSWTIDVTPVQGPALLGPTFSVDITQAGARLYGFVVQFRDTATMTKDQTVQWVKDHSGGPSGPPPDGQTCVNWYGTWCVPTPDLG